MARDKWNSRLTFILASIGSAVGLGNAWRFPGLCAKFGGGAFLFAYIICMLIAGIPLLMMEISVARKTRGGAPKAMRGINKHFEVAGWAATTNAFMIVTYYAVVFAWCILMAVVSFKFATTNSTVETASTLWQDTIQTTWGTSFSGAGGNIPILVVLALVVAWGLIYVCIRNGAASVSKVVKYTVFLPIAMLIILAIRGFIKNPNLGDALGALFVPKWAALGDVNLWVNAMGQVFYSLSIMMAIMFAYGSFLDDKANIAEDAMIIAFSDLAVSVLSGIVLFTTMYSVGMTTEDMSASGIATAFIIYPQAIVKLTAVPWLNAIFGFVFYFMLCTLAIDSAFSIVEGVSTAVSDKFAFDKKKTTKTITLVAAAISVIYITGAGVGWLDIVDHWTNAYSMIICGIMEALAVGWFFKTNKVLDEVNKNTGKFKMPKWWFNTSIKILAPLALSLFLVWQLIDLIKTGGRYNAADYSLAAELIGGWLITIISFSSGLIIKLICKYNKTLGDRVKAVEAQEKSWDEMGAPNVRIETQKVDNQDIEDGPVPFI